MMSPSPSDLVWVICFTPQGRWIAPVVRAAIRVEWRDAQKIAASHLGDETLAPELMEVAIRQTGEYLESQIPIDFEEALKVPGVEETREILSRFYRNAVKRRKRSDEKILFLGTGTEVEPESSSAPSAILAVEAELDLDTILRETTPELRHAMLMRFGTRSSWKEVAEATSKTVDAVRIGCQREMERIRKKHSIRNRSG